MYRHEEHLAEIRDYPWQQVHPFIIVVTSFHSAEEFAKSLEGARSAHPGNKHLEEMIQGELNTDNLDYGGYVQKGNHSEFLKYFLIGSGRDKFTWEHPWAQTIWKEIQPPVAAYNAVLSGMTRAERAMTVFSREQHLPGIFQKILVSHDWEKWNMGFYKYYLEQHILLDSADGGHADLTKEFELDPVILERFYRARLKLYKDAHELNLLL